MCLRERKQGRKTEKVHPCKRDGEREGGSVPGRKEKHTK